MTEQRILGFLAGIFFSWSVGLFIFCCTIMPWLEKDPPAAVMVPDVFLLFGSFCISFAMAAFAFTPVKSND